MYNYENTTSYKSILIPTLIINEDKVFRLSTIQDGFSRWYNIETGGELMSGRNFRGDGYVSFSEAYLLGREVTYKDSDNQVISNILSAHVVVDEEMSDEYITNYDLEVELENGFRISIYSLDFTTDVEGYVVDGAKTLEFICRDLMRRFK